MNITSQSLRQMDRAHHIHPFTHNADMHRVGGNIMVSAEGNYVTDDQGNRLLDGLAGLWCVNVGYNRKEIIDAITAQLNKLCYYPSFFNSTTEPAILLAQKLFDYGLPELSHVLFSNSGSEANETAIKVILNYWRLKGQPDRVKLISRTYSYHGVTLGATNLTGLTSCTAPFGLPTAGFIRVPAPYRYLAGTELDSEAFAQQCLQETEAIILREGPDSIAALFAEPIQGAGGVIIPPLGYLRGLRELARKYGILYVSDEVITAFGRLGTMYLSEDWGLDPDIQTLAKGITSGYIPLGATRVRSGIAETLMAGGYWAHGHTYSGHPVACAAALANLELMERENLLAHVRDDAGPYFESRMRALAEHPAVGEVRCHFLIGAIELLDNGKKVTDPAKALGPKTSSLIRNHGVIVRGLANLIAISPCLIIDRQGIDALFDGVRKGLDDLVRS
jgi:putrescine---pyruvate transaminase